MSRPKTKFALVKGVTELVLLLRNMEIRLEVLQEGQKKLLARSQKRGRPPGSILKRKFYPLQEIKKAGPGRPRKKKRGRPAGSKNRR